MSAALLDTALAALRAGLSVHPPVEDGTKAPLPFYPNGVDEQGKPKKTWLHPPGRPAGEAQVRKWYGRRRGIGIRTGSESRGLECFEFDHLATYEAFVDAARYCGLADLVERIEAGYREETPGEGVHWFYFCPEIRGNAKLARCPAPTAEKPHQVEALIETRAENGFIIVAPTGGPVHPSGRPYVLTGGGFDSIVAITEAERDALWELARSFDRMPRPVAEAKVKGRPPEHGARPGDAFEREASWDDILGDAGWARVCSRGETTYWRRPDKSIGISATTNHGGSGLLYVFTSSSTFNAEQSYTKFGAFAALAHGGNFSEAARVLRQRGYGSAPEASAGPRAGRAGGPGRDRVDAEAGDEDAEVEIIDLWPKIDPVAFHGIAGEIVRAADPHTEADPVAVLVQFLIGFANAIGRGPHWFVGATTHHLALFAALVGPTSTGRKGSSWNVANFFLEKVDEDWANHRVMMGLSSGEGLIHQVRDRVVKLEEGKEVTVDEGVADKRLLLIESEFGRTLRVMGREGSTLSSVLRQVWDCDRVLSVLSKNAPERATHSHISIIGHITKYELTNLLSKSDSSNGLGNRFFWVCVRRSKELPDGGKFYKADWSAIIGRLRGIAEAARAVGEMQFDEATARAWLALYSALTAGKPGLLGAMLGRAEPYVKRLARVYALLDGSAIVRVEHLEAATALWEYSEASTRFVFGETMGDPNAEKLLAALKAAPEGLTRDQIGAGVFAGHLGKRALAQLIQELLSLGLIHRAPADTSRPGRRPEFWRIGQDFEGSRLAR